MTAEHLDLLFVNAHVYTLDGDRPHAEAVGISGDRIAWVGSDEEASDLARSGVETIDAAGRLLLPGFVEPHTHPELSAQCYSWVDVSGFTHRNVEGVELALREAAGQTPEGQWVFAFGLDPMLTAGLGTWDRHRLDAISPRSPVYSAQSCFEASSETR